MITGGSIRPQTVEDPPGGGWRDPKAVRRAFEGRGIRVTGPGRPVPVLRSDYAIALEDPAAEAPFLVRWLAEKHREAKEFPDVEAGTATLFPAVGGDGAPVWVLTPDGRPPAPALLADPQRWRWPPFARLGVRRGDERRELLVAARPFGGRRTHEEAAKARTALGALRVDLGDMMPHASVAAPTEAFDDLLARAPAMGLDALVPAAAELRLAPAEQARLSAAFPLVAANLKPPAGVAVRPFVLRERAGHAVAIVGIADDAELLRLGLVGGKTGWKVLPRAEALQGAVGDAFQSGAEAVVLATNLDEARLADGFLDRAADVVAVVTPHRRKRELAFTERVTPDSPARTRHPRPWLVAGASSGDVGVLTLGFGPGPGRPRWVENRLRRWVDDGPRPPMAPEAFWARLEKLEADDAAEGAPLLPDKRVLAREEARIAGDADPGHAQFDAADWTRLAASGIRRLAGAEVGVVHAARSGSTIMGEVPVGYAHEWLPKEPVVTLELTGAQLRQLAAVEAGRFTWANFDPKAGLVGGRDLVAAEVYRVATTEDVARSEDYAAILGDAVPRATGRRLDVAVTDRLVAMRATATEDGRRALVADLLDDGRAFEPRWRVDVKPLQASFQQFAVANRGPFGAVRNAAINAPDSTIYGGKGDGSVTYEARDVDWENRARVAYQRAHVQGDKPAEQADSVQLTSEVRIKAFRLTAPGQEPGQAMALVPFVSGNYLTELTPTIDPGTGAENPRRRELNGILGVVLSPGGWLKELRLGAIAKNDLAVQVGGYEPGVQLAAVLAQALGPVVLSFEGDVRNYFLTPEDTADDLGLQARLSAAARVPLWGPLGLSIGVDAFVFEGKVPATRSLGASWTPTVGLTYRAAWKPQSGVLFGLAGAE